jgi:16S rRNA processing protein RimM
MARPDDAIPDGYVAVGRVLGAWGKEGDLKIEPLAPDSAFRKGKQVSISGQQYAIERFRRAGQSAHLKLTGVLFRDQATALRGHWLLTPEVELEAPPEGEYYRFQLIGLRVTSTEGEDIGAITDVMSTGANDVFVVRGPRGEILVPAIEDIVQSVDIEAGVVTIEVVPGLLPEDKPPRQ